MADNLGIITDGLRGGKETRIINNLKYPIDGEITSNALDGEITDNDLSGDIDV